MQTTYHDHHYEHLGTNKRQTLSVIAAGILSPLALMGAHIINAELSATNDIASTDSTTVSSELSNDSAVAVVNNGPVDSEIRVTENPFAVSTPPPTDQHTADYPAQKEASSPAPIASPSPVIPVTPPTGGSQDPAPSTTPNRINELIGTNLYRDAWSAAVNQYNEWQHTQPENAALIKKISDQPIGVWLGGWSNQSQVSEKMAIAAAEGTTPIWVLYHVPNISCSGGGASSVQAYKNWVNAMSNGVGNGDAIIIVEPDALALVDCLTPQEVNDRYDMVKYAVDRFASSNPNAVVYIDAGHSSWIDADTMADRLRRAGVANAQGFSLNVSNFDHTAPNTAYGNTLGNMLDGAHFVVDTSRSGNGPAADSEWCNPWGRALGERPTIDSSSILQDALLWVKYPGESDGYCNGGPNAGDWWADYALDLSRNASY